MEHGVSERLRITTELISASRDSIAVFAPALERTLFNDELLVDALRRFVLGNDHAQVRILILEGGRSLHDCCNLVQVVQRLSSKIELRVVDRSQIRDRQEYHEYFVVTDRRNVVQQHGLAESVFWYYRDAPRRAQVLIDVFEPLWQQALGDPELRRLSL